METKRIYKKPLVMALKTKKVTTKSLFFIGFFLIGIATIAQPSDATILSNLKAKAGKTLISLKLTGSRKGVVQEYENGVRVNNFYRYYESTMKTEYAGVNVIYRGGVKYGSRGGSWKFIQKLIGENSYTGISNPSWEEIKTLLTGNLQKTLGARYGKIVGEITDFRLADKPEWNWPDLTSVEFVVTMTYNEKISNTELQKTRQKYKIRLYAEKFKGPWGKDFLSTTKDQEENLGVTKYSSDELKAMKTLRETNIQKMVDAEIANLPKVTIPSFANHNSFVYYIHNMLLTADEPTIEANLRQLLASGYFDPNLKGVPTKTGLNLINEIKAQSIGYRQQYCKKPQIKHNQTNMTEWYNKNATTYSRLSSHDLGNGKRAISEISLSVPKPTSPEGKALAAMACKVRSNPLKRMFATKLKSNMGAPVFSKYGKSEWFYIGKLDGTSNGGYKIKWLDGSSTVEVVKYVCNFELIPGDLVYIKNSSGQIVQRWITENNGSYVVKVEDLNGRISSVNLKDLRFK